MEKLERAVPSRKLKLGSKGTSMVMICCAACGLVISKVSLPQPPLDEESEILVGDKTRFSKHEVPDEWVS